MNEYDLSHLLNGFTGHDLEKMGISRNQTSFSEQEIQGLLAARKAKSFERLKKDYMSARKSESADVQVFFCLFFLIGTICFMSLLWLGSQKSDGQNTPVTPTNLVQ